MRVKSILIFLLLLAMVGLNGCDKKEEKNNVEDRKIIQFVAKAKTGDYWSVVKAGADAAAKEFNVNLIFTAPDNEQDINEQIEIVNEAVEEKVDGLILAASDYNALASVAKKAYDKKIPVIITDSEVNTDKINSLIITDNYEAGKKAAEKLVEVAGSDARVAIMNFVKGAKNAEQREEGLLSALSKYSGIKIVDRKYCYSDEKLAYELTKQLLASDKNINAFVSLNASASEGVAEAIEEMDLAGKVKLVAFDITPEEIEYIERGVIQATVIQNPFNMGYLSVKYASMASKGEKIPNYVNTDSRVIDKTNMYLPGYQKFVFPFIR